MILRPKQHLIEAEQKFPGVWKRVAALRQGRGHGLSSWPDWCFCPASHVLAAMTSAGVSDSTYECSYLTALAAWRVTQGVYRFDPDLLDALWDTPIEGDIPIELLFRLPEWCVYVECPGRTFYGATMHGFFAHLDALGRSGEQPELWIVADTHERGLRMCPLPLRADGLHRCLQEVDRVAVFQGASSEQALRAARSLVPEWSGILSLLLYLCCEEREIRDSAGTEKMPKRQTPARPKKGVRHVPEPSCWDVGYRIGATLRSSRLAHESSPTETGTHTRPRPHIRRAHWHAFWKGPHAQPDERRLDVRWLPPIAVALDDVDGLVPVVRTVGPRDQQ